MIITVKRNEQSATYTVDTKDCSYPSAIRNAIRIALELEGYSDSHIDEVFGIMPKTAQKQD